MPTVEITIDDLLREVTEYRNARASGELTDHHEFYLKGLDFAIYLVTSAFQRIEIENKTRIANAALDELARITAVS